MSIPPTLSDRSSRARGIMWKPSSVFATWVLLSLSLTGQVLVLGQSKVQTRPELVLQTGHSRPVNAIALSAAGRFLVSASDDTTLKVWDTSSGNVLRTLFGHEKPVLGVAVSPDGKFIASGSEDGEVRVWNVITGEPRRFGRHDGLVKDLAFSTDSRQLTSLGDTELKLWDVASGRELRETRLNDEKGNARAAMAMAPNPRLDQTATALTSDGKYAAIGGGITYKSGVLGYGGGLRSKPIRVIETASGRELESLKLKGDLPNPKDLSFSPDGRLLAAKFVNMMGRKNLDFESSLTVYEVATGRVLKSLPVGDLGGSGGIAFSPDGKILASRVNASKIDQAAAANPSNLAALSQLEAGSIKFLDVTTWTALRELKNTGFDVDFARANAATPLCFDNDGKVLAASLKDGVALIDTTTGNRIRLLETTQRASAMDLTQGMTNIGQTNAGADQMGEMQQQIKEMMGEILGANSPFDQMTQGSRISTRSLISFSPDGRLLVSAKSATVWDVSAGTPRRRPPSQMFSAMAFGGSNGQDVFSPDGKMSASLGPNGVLIRDTTSGQILRTISIGKSGGGPFQGAQISGLALGTRGLVIHFCEFKMQGKGGIFMGGGGGSQECHIKTFDPKSGQELRDLKLDTDKGSFMGFGNLSAISPDGRFLVALIAQQPGGGGMFKPSFPGFGRRGGGEPPKQPYKIRLTDADNGKKLWEIKIEAESMFSAPNFVFSSGGEVLAITSMEKKAPVINLYEAGSGRKLGMLDSGDRKIATMNFSRDGKLLATTYGSGSSATAARTAITGTGDTKVTIWDCSTGRQLFTLSHETPVIGVAFSPDEKLIATLGADGNQYLWDERTGEKLATLVNLDVLNVSGNNNEWLVVTPDGLFDGSPGAWQQIMWRFSQNTFDVGPVEIFFNELYYPGLAGEVFSGKRPKAPRDIQQFDRRQPTVKVGLSKPASGEVNARSVNVKVEIAEAPSDSTHSKGSGARDVRLFRNGTLVKVWRGDVLKGQPQATLETTLTVVAGENRITAYGFNDDNVKSSDSFLDIVGSRSLDRRGTAYVLAFGVNQYSNDQYNLKYAGADAEDFVEEVKDQQARLDKFGKIEVVEMLDKEATKQNLMLALRRLAGDADLPPGAPASLGTLQKAQPEDAVMIYFAGHGTAKGSRFYLVPHDMGYSGSRSGIDAQAVETILTHSISDLELEAAVEGLDAGELLLVIDACNSGQALEAEEKRRGPMNSKGLAQLAYEKGMYILTAAQSYQAALEAAQLGHGYLTYTLVEEGLKKGLADREQKDGQVSVREWFDYATERVPEMQEQNAGSRLLLEDDEKTRDKGGIRNLQRPRAFYRREAEARPVIIGKP
jgi:WD40 repeat protein